MRLSTILAMFICLVWALPAEARSHRHHHPFHHYAHHHGVRSGTLANYSGRGGRPHAWCGWQMRQWYGGGPELNLARNWAHVGTNAGNPAIGVIVVWAHHVGRIVGGGPGHWLIQSGNDGHAIRTRQRSVAKAIAFRWPGGAHTTRRVHIVHAG